MKEFKMYSKVKDLLLKGFSERKTSEMLGINRKTVNRYHNMTLDEDVDKTARPLIRIIKTFLNTVLF